MSNFDPPKHTRIRRHNLWAFSARRVATVEPKVRAKAEELVERLTEPHDDFTSDHIRIHLAGPEQL